MEAQSLSFLNLLSREMLTLAIFLLVFLFVFDALHSHIPKNFPPGPFRLPFVGNMFQLDLKKPHLQFCKLAEKYGDIFSLRVGYSHLVVLNGLNAFKEAMVRQTDIFAGPAAFPIFEDLVKGHVTNVVNRNIYNNIVGVPSPVGSQQFKNVAHYQVPEDNYALVVNAALVNDVHVLRFSNGDVWREQRKFVLMTLRSFGVGQKSLEAKTLEEIKYLHDSFKKENGQPFNPQTKINISVTNIICSIVFGERFDYNDPHSDLQEINLLLDKFGHTLESIWVQLYNSFPKLVRHLPGPHNNIFVIWKRLEDFMEKKIKEHRETWNPAVQRDFIDCFLLQMQKGTPNSSFDDQNLLRTTLDLFFAGSETTTTTLLWALMYMAAYPDIQEKVHDEIVSVIGQQDPVMDDRINLPYTNAVVHEIQRKGCIAPFTLTRETTRDTTVGKHFIPKGTNVLANLYSVLMDKSEWETPDEFNPEHFLDKNGKFVRKEAFVPFSGGKRNCMGEPLARMELFLFFTSLMQKFKFVVPEGVEISLDGIMNLTHRPQPYKICAVLR